MVILIMFLSGCALSMSSMRASDPSIQTHYYSTSYDKVINAAVEAASKMEDWNVQDVDESLGLITVGETNIWRYYVIKIFIKKNKNKQVSVDVSLRHSRDIVSFNKKYIKEFYERLDKLLK